MLPHPWAIDQNFVFLVKSPPLARTPPNGVYIDRCITQPLAFVTERSLFDLEPSTRRLLRGLQRAFLLHLLSSFGFRQLH